jgi:hypothetical protein
VNVETSSTTYSKYFMEELACMHDLTRTSSLRTVVSDYMQVYFADAAIEYISALGVRGGAKSRVYHDHYSLDDSDPLGEVGWLLGWTGNSTSTNYAQNTFGNYYVHMAATSWRPLPQLALIAHANSMSGGSYAKRVENQTFLYSSQRLGRAADGGGDGGKNGQNLAVCKRDGGPRAFASVPICLVNLSRPSISSCFCLANICTVVMRIGGAMEAGICYFLNITHPGLLRQTWVDPEFMLGTLSFDQRCKFTAISSQNNLMGAVFSASVADRLVFGGTGYIQSGKHGGYPLGTEFLSLTAVQVGPAAVLQRPIDAAASNGSYVFVSGALPHRGRPLPPGLGLLPSLRTTPEGWHCFHDSNGWENHSRGAFGCFRLVGNEGVGETLNRSISSVEASDSGGGLLLLPRNDMWSPIVVQLARASDYSSFDDFVSLSIRCWC